MKKLFGIIVLLAIMIYTLYQLSILPVVIDNTERNIQQLIYKKNNDSIEYFKGIDFNSGQYTVFIIFDEYDRKLLTNSTVNSKILYSNDTCILNKMNDNFVFKICNGMMVTCTNLMFIYKGDSLIFKGDFCFTDEYFGFQDSHLGWIECTEPTKIINSFCDFKPIYKPFVVFK